MCMIWQDDFEEFDKWATSNGYSDSLEIDRIDNDEGYFPENCRWVTKQENSNNKRTSIKIDYNGQNI